jgi:hypothetical protein
LALLSSPTENPANEQGRDVQATHGSNPSEDGTPHISAPSVGDRSQRKIDGDGSDHGRAQEHPRGLAEEFLAFPSIRRRGALVTSPYDNPQGRRNHP